MRPGLNHAEAVKVLKSCAASTSVSLHVIDGQQQQNEVTLDRDFASSFVPTWDYWLHLPAHVSAKFVRHIQYHLCHLPIFCFVFNPLNDCTRGFHHLVWSRVWQKWKGEALRGGGEEEKKEEKKERK